MRDESPSGRPAMRTGISHDCQSDANGGRARSAGVELKCGAGVRSAVLLVLLALATVGGDAASAASATGGAPTLPAQADEVAVRALATRMIEAWNRGDAGGFAEAFAEDGELISGDGTRLVGRQEIEQYIARILMSRIRFSSAVIGVRLIHPDIAVWTADGGFLRPGETEIASD